MQTCDSSRERNLVGLNVTGGQQCSDRAVELLAAANIFESSEEVLRAQTGSLAAFEIVQDAALVHHDDAIAEIDGLLHGVGNHQGGELISRNNVVRQANDLVRGLGVECCGVLIKQQQVRA